MTLLRTAALAAIVLRAPEACCSHRQGTRNRPAMTPATDDRRSASRFFARFFVVIVSNFVVIFQKLLRFFRNYFGGK